MSIWYGFLILYVLFAILLIPLVFIAKIVSQREPMQETSRCASCGRLLKGDDLNARFSRVLVPVIGGEEIFVNFEVCPICMAMAVQPR